jgi:hypothetical protein
MTGFKTASHFPKTKIPRQVFAQQANYPQAANILTTILANALLRREERI